MNVYQLAEHQLTAIHQHKKESQVLIEQEWIQRYTLPYPYKLNLQGKVINVENDKEAKDMPKEVAEKAKILKYRLELKAAGQTEIFDFI